MVIAGRMYWTNLLVTLTQQLQRRCCPIFTAHTEKGTVDWQSPLFWLRCFFVKQLGLVFVVRVRCVRGIIIGLAEVGTVAESGAEIDIGEVGIFEVRASQKSAREISAV